jgi:hypothetical protein
MHMPYNKRATVLPVTDDTLMKVSNGMGVASRGGAHSDSRGASQRVSWSLIVSNSVHYRVRIPLVDTARRRVGTGILPRRAKVACVLADPELDDYGFDFLGLRLLCYGV